MVTSGESRRYVVAFTGFACGGIWLYTSREFKAHFGLPGYAPGTIAVNVTWMERGFNACQTHRSMYLSIFTRLPVIQPVSSKVHRFSTFFTPFGLPWVRPWDNRGKCYIDKREFNAGHTHHSMYPSIFNRLRAIAKYWSEIATFSYPLHLTPRWGVPIGIPGKS